ncbi:nitroreductase family protein [Phocaeicola sartorii]|uniref:nitroreductase family protein n=1 Tax=Phocaeicola sartorii TaxID=671267 RepID=UPI001F58FD69|nr:nitroreductase family protein [Phocaeicola sartorii]
MQNNQALSAIFHRHSVRRFTGEKLSGEQIETLLRAAMAAPTSMNVQPWQFVVITDEALVRKLSEVHPYARMIGQAGTGIVVCGDTSLYERFNRLHGEDHTLYWVQDTSAASENILLAAFAMGLGAVWTGVYPLQSRIAKLQELLNIPSHIIPLNIIVVGYPESEVGREKDKWDEQKIHYNTYK